MCALRCHHTLPFQDVHGHHRSNSALAIDLWKGESTSVASNLCNLQSSELHILSLFAIFLWAAAQMDHYMHTHNPLLTQMIWNANHCTITFLKSSLWYTRPSKHTGRAASMYYSRWVILGNTDKKQATHYSYAFQCTTQKVNIGLQFPHMNLVWNRWIKPKWNETAEWMTEGDFAMCTYSSNDMTSKNMFQTGTQSKQSIKIDLGPN